MNTGRHSGKPGRLRFQRSAKLNKPTEFKRVFKRNRVSTDRYFRILYRPNEEQSNRLGMAVSRRIDKRAVCRNRIKRIIRESFRQNFSRETVKTNHGQVIAGGHGNSATFFDLVVLPRRECATICNRQLFDSLERHWSRISEADVYSSKAVNSDRG